MFEDLTEPTIDELKDTIADQARIISDLEEELIGREREIRDADKRNGEYVEMIDKMRDLIQRYFGKYGKDLFEEWQMEQEKPKIEAELIDDDD
ncbi:MAG: hypothetical protein JSV31_29230 [Desulfobacterales bacterium]|nr:MAG: hypothetical protein JSV31_29230 [Desulfobacterales bacterium]